jgi:hypothetical protein
MTAKTIEIIEQLKSLTPGFQVLLRMVQDVS